MHGPGVHIHWVGLLLGAIILVAQAWAIETGRDNLMTITFHVFCLSQMGHVWAIRSARSFFRTGLLSPPPLPGAVALPFGLQALVTFVPLFQGVFNTQALTLEEFVVVGALSVVVFLGVEVEKISMRNR